MKKIFFLCLFICTTNSSLAISADALSQAKEDMHLNRYQAVLNNLRELVNQEQDNYEAWFLFGVAHVHEGQHSQAIEAFRQVIALRPELAEPHNNLAAVYSDLGDTKAAVRELEVALEKRPNYIVAEENLADLYIKLALQHYRNTLKQSANPIIEERYARLIQVRNPMEIGSHTASPSVEAAHMESTALAPKPVNAEPSIPQPKHIPSELEPTHEAIEPTPHAPSKPIITQDKPTNAEPVTPTIVIHQEQSITGVLDALEIWRKAWSAQNINAYFSAYADDYKPEKRFGSIDAWKAYKTRVTANKKFIQVNFEQVEVNMHDDKRATVMFLQRFRSNSYNGDDLKRITLKYTAAGWKIVSEASVQ